MSLEVNRSSVDTVAAAPGTEERSPASTRLALLGAAWGAVWFLGGLLLILHDLAELDWLWEGAMESGGVGVLVAGAGGVSLVLAGALYYLRYWAYFPTLLLYAFMAPVAVIWLFKFNTLTYGLIHAPVFLFGGYLALSDGVRDDLHASPFGSYRKAVISFAATGVALGLLFTFSGDKIVSTMVGVTLSIGVAGALFVGLNQLFDLTRTHWSHALAIMGLLVGLLVAGFAVMNGFPGGPVTMVLGGVAGLVGGYLWGASREPSLRFRERLIDRARVWIFVGPALIFVTVALIIPTLRTLFLSFFSADSSEWVGLDNYEFVFTDDRFFNMDGVGDILTSRMFSVGLILLVIGVGAAIIYGRRRGAGPEFAHGVPSVGTGAAVVLILLAVFTALRGAIWNNLWWVTAVTFLSTSLGLLVAALAERTKRESFWKSLIFLPMAISFVGASVIWKFIYDFSTRGDQIGLLNAIWQQFGNDPVFWLGERPWNNMLLIVIMIWIQTGFAMVVLSAALKSVPEDQVEAAKVDGATEVNIFWNVTIPHIRSAIAVVVTTLIILVMKVYDIVKVMTNGEFGTEVIANSMFNQAFTFRSFGRGSALATILFLAVLPLMFLNIRRIRKEEQIR